MEVAVQIQNNNYTEYNTGTVMINKSKYEQTKSKRSLRTRRNSNGDMIYSVYVETSVWTKRLVKMEGMNMCKKKELMTILADVVKSNTEMKIISYLLEHQNQKSFVKLSSGKPATVKSLSALFGVTDRKIRGLLKKLEEKDLIKRNSKVIYVNPFIQLPYGNSKDSNFIVQMMWKYDYKMTEEELLETHSEDLDTNRTVEM